VTSFTPVILISEIEHLDLVCPEFTGWDIFMAVKILLAVAGGLVHSFQPVTITPVVSFASSIQAPFTWPWIVRPS